jgi:hypothetical protein
MRVYLVAPVPRRLARWLGYGMERRALSGPLGRTRPRVRVGVLAVLGCPQDFPT